MRGLFIIGLIFWYSAGVQGQSLFYTKYDENQGLENTNINVVMQDPHGFLWIGTMDGLFKFDGSTFSEVLFSDENTDKAVYDIGMDNDLALWIVGKNGLTSFNGSTFTHFDLNDEFTTRDRPARLAIVDQEMYFLNGSGSLFKFRNKKLEKMQDLFGINPEQIIDWYSTNGNKLWILSERGNVYLFSDNSLKGPYMVLEDKTKLRSFAGGSIMREGSLDLISDKGILEVKMDDSGTSFLHHWKYRNDRIHAFLTDSNNREWSVQNDNLIRIAGSDTSKIDFAIPLDASVKIYEDFEQNIWLAISPGGLYKFPGDEITRLNREEIGNYTPSSYMYLNHEIWVSYFGAGVKKWSEKSATGSGWEEVNGLISNYVRDMVHFQNEIWFITARGVSRKKGNNMMHFTTSNGLPHNYCYKATVDPSGRILIGTERGIAIFENEKFRPLSTDVGTDVERVKYLTTIKDGSVLIMKENSIDQYRANEMQPFIHDGLLNKEILNTVTEDQFGNFWIGSDLNGLIYYNREDGILKYLSRDQGLPFSRVRTIIPYGDQGICLGTEKGIFYIGITGAGEILRIQACGMEMGYPDMEVNMNASLRIDNRIYFGTNLGTIIFHPGKLNIHQTIPVVNITGFDLSFRETDWKNTSQKLNSWFGIPVQPVLNHEQNDLLILYGAISLQSGDKLWYKYWLENNDKTWSEPTKNTSAIYANLSPGKYIFHVKASYDGFNWGELDTNYNLIIAPPFWKTWWFYVIAFSFVLAGFILFNNYRIKSKINQLLAIERLKKEEYSRIQKKIAMDFHDEVGNHLTSISLLVELIKSREWEVEDELKILLNKIDNESKNLFRGTKDFIWSIDPANDNLKAVYYNIRDYGLDLFDNSSIQFHAQNGDFDFSTIKLPAGFTRHIVLIFKEGLNNVLKHAGCKNVNFSITISGTEIELKLKDDGRGFKEQDLHYIEGIKKMKYRGAKIKSNLILNSDENLGTEIILKAKI
jgi:signal transduction histidine kinase/ligand-binding sensor domain-containing protein